MKGVRDVPKSHNLRQTPKVSRLDSHIEAFSAWINLQIHIEIRYRRIVGDELSDINDRYLPAET